MLVACRVTIDGRFTQAKPPNPSALPRLQTQPAERSSPLASAVLEQS
jgi:hypothetical protein